MTDQISKDQVYEILFMNLVLMFQTSAMQHMGKLKNPMTDKIEKNMEQAQMSIDILDMLKAKTANNLSEHETTFLERAISELKLNYVDELKKDPASGQPETEAETKAGEEPAAQPAQESAGEKTPADEKTPPKKKKSSGGKTKTTGKAKTASTKGEPKTDKK